MNKKHFNIYRSEYSKQKNHTRKKSKASSDGSGISKGSKNKVVKNFSMQDIIDMSQSELSQAVFTLSDRHMELLEADNEITPLQNKLAKCKQFEGLDIELVPRYRFF